MYLNIMCVIFSRKRSIKECICRTHSLLFLAQLAILPTADSESEAREVSFNLPNIGGDPSIRGPPGAWGMGKQCWPGVVKGQKLHPAPHDISQEGYSIEGTGSRDSVSQSAYSYHYEFIDEQETKNTHIIQIQLIIIFRRIYHWSTQYNIKALTHITYRTLNFNWT